MSRSPDWWWTYIEHDWAHESPIWVKYGSGQILHPLPSSCMPDTYLWSHSKLIEFHTKNLKFPPYSAFATLEYDLLLLVKNPSTRIAKYLQIWTVETKISRGSPLYYKYKTRQIRLPIRCSKDFPRREPISIWPSCVRRKSPQKSKERDGGNGDDQACWREERLCEKEGRLEIPQVRASIPCWENLKVLEEGKVCAEAWIWCPHLLGCCSWVLGSRGISTKKNPLFFLSHSLSFSHFPFLGFVVMCLILCKCLKIFKKLRTHQSIFFYVSIELYKFGWAFILLWQVLELAGNAARDNKKSRIIPRHVLLAVRNDEELGKLLHGVTISHGGVLPNIHSVLLPKKTDKGNAEATKAPKSPKKDWRNAFSVLGVLTFCKWDWDLV